MQPDSSAKQPEPAEKPKMPPGPDLGSAPQAKLPEPDPVKPEPTPPADASTPKVIQQQGGHKRYKWPMIILVVIVAAIAAWWFLIRKDKVATPTTSTTTQSTQTTTNMLTPDNVAYAFKAKDSDPYALYYRPAAGGVRVQAKTLAANETMLGGDTSGSNVVVATSKAIYTSIDGGKNYTAVLTLSSNEQVTSIKLATDGRTIVYGDLPAPGGKNTVKTMDLTGKNNTSLFTSAKAGVFLGEYSPTKQKIIYSEGCYNCDGNAGPTMIRDLKTNEAKEFYKDIGLTAANIADSVVSSDFSTLFYITDTPNPAGDKTVEVFGLIKFTGPPYTVNAMDLSSKKVTKIATVGTKGDKNANGTLKTSEINVGYIAGTNTPYYSVDKQLFTVKAGKPTLTFEATNSILNVSFVSTGIVITGSGKDTSDFALTNYDISTKKTVKIFQGDNNTIIFGVTTK